jgi:anti-sigma factor RsiW
MADLAALADGTLPEDRRAEVEARVAASPELQELLDRQREAVAALQTASAEEVPSSVRHAVEAHLPSVRRGRTRRLVPRLVLATAAAVAGAVIAAVLLTSGPGAPTIADAARLAGRAPNRPAPAEVGTRLAVGVQGVRFPNLAWPYGWRAVGVRQGRVDGRAATVVFYGKGARRLAYVIVSGAALSRPGKAAEATVDGVEYQTLRLTNQLAVTWRRGGHTCVLLGQAGRTELLRLASWPVSASR